MPELPEVENVRLGLCDALLGQTIDLIERHGKQLAITGNQGTSLCLHLGMTGSLQVHQPQNHPSSTKPVHQHVVWSTESGQTLIMTDPRRFGGIWTYPSRQALIEQRWNQLGQDALVITAKQLAKELAGRKTPIKSALLDQRRIAGLGNIYVDELLFQARIHPLTSAGNLSHTARSVPSYDA